MSSSSSDKPPPSNMDNNSIAKSKKVRSQSKRKHITFAELNTELEKQNKKMKTYETNFKNLENKLTQMVKSQKTMLESKIKKNTDKIHRNMDDIEELYDNYDETYDTNNDINNDKEERELKADFGKRLITIITGGAPGSGKSNLAKDIKTILDELKLNKRRAEEVEYYAKQYAENCIKLKIKFVFDELKHFMSETEEYQERVVKSLKEIIDSKLVSDEPYSLRVMSSGMIPYVKQIVLNKVNQLNNLEPGQGEYYKLKKWIDTAIGVPWGKYRSINVVSKEIPNYLTKSRSI